MILHYKYSRFQGNLKNLSFCPIKILFSYEPKTYFNKNSYINKLLSKITNPWNLKSKFIGRLNYKKEDIWIPERQLGITTMLYNIQLRHSDMQSSIYTLSPVCAWIASIELRTLIYQVRDQYCSAVGSYDDMMIEMKRVFSYNYYFY